MENNPIFTTVRGVQIPTAQIQRVEDEYGVKLVPDSKPKMLLTLDRALQLYRLSHNGRDPDLVMIQEYPEFYFKHMVLNIFVLGLELPGSQNKPCWFSVKRQF